MRLELFNLSIERLIIRFYMFMALVLLGGFAHLSWGWTVAMGMVVFVTGFLGIPYHSSDRRTDNDHRTNTSSNANAAMSNRKERSVSTHLRPAF